MLVCEVRFAHVVYSFGELHLFLSGCGANTQHSRPLAHVRIMCKKRPRPQDLLHHYHCQQVRLFFRLMPCRERRRHNCSAPRARNEGWGVPCPQVVCLHLVPRKKNLVEIPRYACGVRQCAHGPPCYYPTLTPNNPLPLPQFQFPL